MLANIAVCKLHVACLSCVHLTIIAPHAVLLLRCRSSQCFLFTLTPDASGRENDSAISVAAISMASRVLRAITSSSWTGPCGCYGPACCCGPFLRASWVLPSLMLLKVQRQHMHKDATSANLALMVHLGNMEYCNSVAKQCLDLCNLLCLTACLLFDHQLACEEDYVAPHLTLGLTCNIACIMHKIHCGIIQLLQCSKTA